MENVCHTLAGLALARAGLARTTPLATTALVVGANLPDVDLAWSSFRSALVYYDAHRGWTHSIAGFFLLVLLWWIALLAADRLLGGRTAGRAKPLPLLGAAAIGLASHILMDATNSYGVRPFLPWNGRWIYGDLWVIVDPWLWLFLGGAVYLSGTGRGRRDVLWLMAAAAAAIVVLFTPVVPAFSRAAWAAGLALTLAVVRRAARHPKRRRLAALAGLGLVALYACLCAVSHQAALARIERIAADDPSLKGTGIAALPRPADPLRWEGVIVSASVLSHGTVGALPFLDKPGAASSVMPRGLDLPAFDGLTRTCAGAVVRGFFRFPCAVIEEEPGGGRTLVVRDARYTRRGGGFAVYAAPLDRDGLPIVDPDECP